MVQLAQGHIVHKQRGRHSELSLRVPGLCRRASVELTQHLIGSRLTKCLLKVLNDCLCLVHFQWYQSK